MATTAKQNPYKVVLCSHRVSYVHIKEPSAVEEGSTPLYSVVFLIPKDSPDVDRIKAVIKAVYDANKDSMFGGRPLTSPKLWNPLRDGDEVLEERPERKEYEGVYYLKASSRKQPKAFDRDKQEILDLDEVYSGCYCRGVLVCAPFNNKSAGFKFYLNSVMKTGEGERLGGFEATADDYDDIEDDGDFF